MSIHPPLWAEIDGRWEVLPELQLYPDGKWGVPLRAWVAFTEERRRGLIQIMRYDDLLTMSDNGYILHTYRYVLRDRP